jgi:hypothetical protein
LDVRGRKWQEVENITQNFINCTLHQILLSYQIKEDKIGRICSTQGAARNAYKILVGKPDGNRPP